MKIIFLDIDGVLLPACAHMQRDNLRRLGAIVAIVSSNPLRNERYPVDSDTVAVALID